MTKWQKMNYDQWCWKWQSPDEITIGIFNRDDAVEFMKQGLEAPTILLVKGPEILNYMVDHGIEIDEIDVGGMGAKEGRSVLYKNISTNPEENKNFLDLIQKGVNVFVPGDASG